MKKNYNPVSDVRNESVDGSRRIYRAIADLARNLDENRERAQSCAELFLPNVEAQRVKLRDSCEKIIFTDPLGHGRKGEELLWRKGYYDVVATAKRLRKNNIWSEDEAAYLQSHLFAGVGHYHHIIFRLQIECKLDLRGIVDFPLLVSDGGLTKGKTSLRGQDGAGAEWARQTLHRSLVSLGDLSRYFLEIEPQWDTGLSQRYYLQAISLNAEIGMPHNQLGTLSGAQNYSVDAAYHYMRCLSCVQSFEGAEGNLRRILEKNHKWLEHHNRWKIDDKEEEMSPAERIHRFIARFLVLVDVWFFDKTSPANPNQLCQHVVEDLKHCLLYTKCFPSDAHLSPEKLDLEELLGLESSQESEKPEYLKDDVVFELVAMLLLCISHFKAKRSKLMPTLVNFTLAVLSELVQQVVEHIQDSVLSIPHPSTPDNYVAPSNPPSQEDPSPVSTSEDSSTIQTNSSSPTLTHLENETTDNNSTKVSNPRSNGNLRCEVHGKKGERQKTKKKGKKMKYLSKFRRRRPKPVGHNSSEESDYSDAEIPYGSSFSSDEGNEDISETDERRGSSSEDDDDDDDDDDEEDDDSDESSSITQVDSKEMIVRDDKAPKDSKLKANGDCSRNCSPEPLLEKIECVNGELANGVHEKGLENGVTTGDPARDLDVLEKGVKVHGPADPADLIELVADEGLLQVVKVCSDWLLLEEDALCGCVGNNPLLLSRLVALLNLINVDTAKLEKCKENAKIFKLKNIKEIFQKVPLTEDVKLKGVYLLKGIHDEMDWEFCRKNCLHAKEEALLRVFKLVEFGKFVASINSGEIINYSETQRMFTVSSAVAEAIEKEGAIDNGSEGLGGKEGVGAGREGGGRGREEVMAHMGTLWLRAQVRELETREQQQQRRRRAAALSPYVAVDCEALTGHLALVKQLVAARRFIVLIPAVVVSALDELKREVGRAREAIRWLETQFQRGNRFLRAQRLHERLPLPLIKYPKKKERDAWAFFQVLECCYYFSKQNGVHDLGPDTPLVTLLTGHRPPLDATAVPASYSPLGVASSAGLHLEHIEAFHAKWKTTSKSHG